MSNSFKNYYLENGYVIFKSLISDEKIEKILFELKRFKESNRIYYSQSEHNWRKIRKDLDSNGLLECSFENFTDLPWAKDLSKAGREILQSQEILFALRKLSDFPEFCMWQNMFFDKSTGTIDHIDTWYLDTDPMGYLFGAWVALEDIDGRGGVFHVYPKSHLSLNKSWKNISHEEFINWSKVESQNFEKKPLLLKKGDLLLWHPSLIHGSTLQKEKGYSRKSLTAHYYPINFLRGGGGKNSIMDNIYEKKLIKEKSSMRSYSYPIMARSSRREITKFATIGIIKFIFSALLNKPKNLMNRKNYK